MVAEERAPPWEAQRRCLRTSELCAKATAASATTMGSKHNMTLRHYQRGLDVLHRQAMQFRAEGNVQELYFLLQKAAIISIEHLPRLKEYKLAENRAIQDSIKRQAKADISELERLTALVNSAADEEAAMLERAHAIAAAAAPSPAPAPAPAPAPSPARAPSAPAAPAPAAAAFDPFAPPSYDPTSAALDDSLLSFARLPPAPANRAAPPALPIPAPARPQPPAASIPAPPTTALPYGIPQAGEETLSRHALLSPFAPAASSSSSSGGGGSGVPSAGHAPAPTAASYPRVDTSVPELPSLPPLPPLPAPATAPPLPPQLPLPPPLPGPVVPQQRSEITPVMPVPQPPPVLPPQPAQMMLPQPPQPGQVSCCPPPSGPFQLPSQAPPPPPAPAPAPAPAQAIEPIKPNGPNELKAVHFSSKLLDTFMHIAGRNTARNLETCAILAGKMSKGTFFITTLIVPKQTSTSDSVTATDEEEIFDAQDQRGLLPLGWIHTHPQQTCFLSSIDLHTHCAYQTMLDEAIAIVMAPTDRRQKQGIFHLTAPEGLKLIQACPRRGFHPHDPPPSGGPIYKHSSHTFFNNKVPVDVVDLR